MKEKLNISQKYANPMNYNHINREKEWDFSFDENELKNIKNEKNRIVNN